MTSFFLILIIILIVWLTTFLIKKAKDTEHKSQIDKRSTLELVRSERSGSRVIAKECARLDGSSSFIGYGDVDILSPDNSHICHWVYDGEPPHGDSLNFVWFDETQLSGRFWGRGHAWSPDSKYFTVEKYSPDRSQLFVVRSQDRKWYSVAEQSSVISIQYPIITYVKYGKQNSVETFVFTGDEEWLPIM